MANLDDDGIEDNDPFSIENATKLNLIVNMRIYDVLMALLTIQSKSVAENLHQLHEQGKILGSLPWFNLDDNSNGDTN